MVRLACVDLPAFPLQLLLRQCPDWISAPAAVVDVDTPQGQILWRNRLARQHGILPGMRYATALTLSPLLRAGVVSQTTITNSVETLARQLQQFSPIVEPHVQVPGQYWLDAMGVTGLYPSLTAWGQALIHTLHSEGWYARIVIGFTRWGAATVVRATTQSVWVLPDATAEAQAVRTVPLSTLSLPPLVQQELRQLGLTTVGDVLSLPITDVRLRFGDTVARLFYQLSTAEEWPPLQSWQPTDPLTAQVDLDYPETDRTRLLFLLRRLLLPLWRTAHTCRQGITALHWQCTLDDHSCQRDGVRPAVATLDSAHLIELVRLRLEHMTVSAGIIALTLTVHVGSISEEQWSLFANGTSRDLSAASRALARLRATFGETVVGRARLREGHLPEAQWTWEPVQEVSVPRPRLVSALTLVRRFFTPPLLLAPPPRHGRDHGWLIAGSGPGPVTQINGPFVITGGWWQGLIEREYAFVETRRGDLLWVFYDRRRRRWALQGRVV